MADKTRDPTIETERLILTPFSHEHTEFICAIRANPKVFFWRTPDTRSQAIEWFEARLADPVNLGYIVSLKDDPSNILGSVGAVRPPEIGYAYLPSAWGKGIATEALRGWIDTYWKRFPEGHPSLGEKERGMLTADTGPEEGNQSPSVLKKNGFVHAGQVPVEEEGETVMLDRWRLDRPIDVVTEIFWMEVVEPATVGVDELEEAFVVLLRLELFGETIELLLGVAGVLTCVVAGTKMLLVASVAGSVKPAAE
ncbi:uncharacterized protein KY384_004053 [Bacidia gigantensis]|uniref:uncharacterized protein n=1 Tax=Bacidia gigantensis TaxID=2732470 RepID=UPI001D04DDB2|nr:uncharacterized protein KY384_004053 [Bacidia gigantensis]KAG8530697.1 hypothetical protein KY384_004053 [Bacidia gigantensis]